MNLQTLPTSPGVYLFKNTQGDIIYVGKAKNLRSRVRSYFSNTAKGAKTELLVRNIKEVDHIIVQNEVEALLLENKLIKKHQPKFNIMLKDGKTFAYLKITDEKFPRLLSTRRVTKKGTYFGPYTDGSARYQIQHLAKSLFKLRVCKTLPKRPCLNYHIGLCTAPCIGAVSKDEYAGQVERAKRFLKGETKEVVGRLKREMSDASKQTKYEIALEKRRQIEAIEHLHDKQTVDLIKKFDQNVVACKKVANRAVITLFSISKGVISGKKDYEFEADEDVFESFIKLYYSAHKVPNEIIVNDAFWSTDQEKSVIEQYLARIRGGKVVLTCPQRGQKRKLVELAEKNLLATDAVLVELQEKLTLQDYPRVIECFDISNLGYDYVVGAMTQWVNGKANKSGYRRFEIKGQKGQDDFAAMRECVYRRYHRLLHEQKAYPDLIIVDGGPGQLNAALGALDEISAKIPIISLAKQEEEIYIPGREDPLQFDKNSPMMLLVRKIRDSVHKFVLSYNRKKREMRLRDESSATH